MIKMRTVFMVMIFSVAMLLCGLFVFGCANIGEAKEPEPQFPEIVAAPAAGNIVLGDAVSNAKLSYEFSVAGTLDLSDPTLVPQEIGKHKCGWTFTPEDAKNYRKLSGDVDIEVFRYKLTFEENGGFDIPDVYFNDSYTIKNKPLTCKNDYRFDGWTATSGGAVLDFPQVFTNSQTLYANYMTCTIDKLFFAEGGYVAELSWQKYWLDRGEPDKAARNLSPDLRYTDDIPEDALGGEIIIPDMHDGKFITGTRRFSHSNITSIVFNNVMIDLDDFNKTKLKTVTIPNTINSLGSELFRGCVDLKEIIYEGGESAIGPIYDERGYVIFGENGGYVLDFEYKLRLRKADILLGVPSLERIEYRNVTSLGQNLWLPIKSITIPNTVELLELEAFYGCDKLEEVIFEDGINLKRIEHRAFGQCKSLRKIKIPESAIVFADAFEGCDDLEEIDITDEQITDIARHLHSAYIDGYIPLIWDEETHKQIDNPNGYNDDFVVNITRGPQYAGINAQGAYVHGEEAIDLYIDKFDVHAIAVLCHEFFHHFQQVLCNGVGDETWASVPYYNYIYFNNTCLTHVPPCIIVTNDEEWEAIYEYYLNDYHYDPYLIDDNKIAEWKRPYISLNDDNSNFEEYWNQPLEADAREFASWFTGINYN